ncbi:hypothetical protein E2562_022620 [Oryza meyeriana var. granulata]|uniref:Uncharacterized protein n=1 Tax=Oryza meyeriana var. granulata TaxID=110450 RepID=A0A6G1CS97_9ORYZ|nr:hypothetical protein E2562_022620 [Oryza meyeriana var. granulata]
MAILRLVHRLMTCSCSQAPTLTSTSSSATSTATLISYVHGLSLFADLDDIVVADSATELRSHCKLLVSDIHGDLSYLHGLSLFADLDIILATNTANEPRSRRKLLVSNIRDLPALDLDDRLIADAAIYLDEVLRAIHDLAHPAPVESITL